MVSVLPFCSRADGYTSHRGALQAKMVYVASLNDQVVPIYSGLFTAASHPLILRALYIDGDAYQCVSPFSFFPSLSLILLSDLSRVPVPFPFQFIGFLIEPFGVTSPHAQFGDLG